MVFRVQGAWYSTNTLTTIIHGHVFRSIIRHPPPLIQKDSPQSPSGNELSSYMDLSSSNLRQYTDSNADIKCIKTVTLWNYLCCNNLNTYPYSAMFLTLISCFIEIVLTITPLCFSHSSAVLLRLYLPLLRYVSHTHQLFY